MQSTIKTAQTLQQSDLLDLISEKILALRIFPFSNKDHCLSWQESLNQSTVQKRYSNALDVPVKRIGMTLFETENKSDKLRQYLHEGRNTRSKIQQIFGKVNPLDQLIDTLASCWQKGCEIQQLFKERMNPGIIRSFEESSNGGLPPHIDSLFKDLPESDSFNDMQCQLAANLYFGVSEKGGNLDIWNYAPKPSELKNLYSGSYDFIDPIKIPTSSQTIQPRLGELILFRSSCIHSVSSNPRGSRSAASCFIGYYDKSQPLTVWA